MNRSGKSNGFLGSHARVNRGDGSGQVCGRWWDALHAEPDQKFSQPFKGTDRGRQADALKLAADRHQPLDRGDQVHAPFVADHGVNFVENDLWTKGREFVDRW